MVGRQSLLVAQYSGHLDGSIWIDSFGQRWKLNMGMKQQDY